MTTIDRTNHEFTLAWTLEAQPAQVFRSWTDPARLGWFYNPEQPTPSDPIEVDLRIGGEWRLKMVIDEDTSYMTGGVYLEIVPDGKLVFAWGAADGWPNLDVERLEDSPLVTVTFEPVDGRTAMTLHVQSPREMKDDGVPGWWRRAQGGWQDTVDRLVAAIG